MTLHGFKTGSVVNPTLLRVLMITRNITDYFQGGVREGS
jgi:hypothetical protein